MVARDSCQQVLEITHMYSAIEALDFNAVPEQFWVHTMPILAHRILAFDLPAGWKLYALFLYNLQTGIIGQNNFINMLSTS